MLVEANVRVAQRVGHQLGQERGHSPVELLQRDLFFMGVAGRYDDHTGIVGFECSSMAAFSSADHAGICRRDDTIIQCRIYGTSS